MGDELKALAQRFTRCGWIDGAELRMANSLWRVGTREEREALKCTELTQEPRMAQRKKVETENRRRTLSASVYEAGGDNVSQRSPVLRPSPFSLRTLDRRPSVTYCSSSSVSFPGGMLFASKSFPGGSRSRLHDYLFIDQGALPLFIVCLFPPF